MLELETWNCTSQISKHVKYYFAHDKLNYARMMPLYLADMDLIKDSNPEIYEEFMQGNWVVKENAQVPLSENSGNSSAAAS